MSRLGGDRMEIGSPGAVVFQNQKSQIGSSSEAEAGLQILEPPAAMLGGGALKFIGLIPGRSQIIEKVAADL